MSRSPTTDQIPDHKKKKTLSQDKNELPFYRLDNTMRHADTTFYTKIIKTTKKLNHTIPRGGRMM